ncbi:zinc-ribbon domain-containing protein [Selenomonas ruminantium]|nr:zinc-ribbon domain-containing protein [Selenomonas ruminantium]
MAKNCVKCGQELQDGADFCPECGTKQPKTIKCPKCGKEYAEGTTFCSECGSKLGEEKSIPAAPVVTEQDFDEAADKLSKAAGGRGKLVAIMGGVIAVLLIAVLAMAFGGGDGSKSKSGSNAIVVKAEEMIDDYIRDQATAEQKYKGKVITVSGQVLQKGQFSNSTDYMIGMSAKDAAGRNYLVAASVPPERVSELNKLNVGDFVNIKGQCVGVVKQDSPTKILVQINADKINE